MDEKQEIFIRMQYRLIKISEKMSEESPDSRTANHFSNWAVLLETTKLLTDVKLQKIMVGLVLMLLYSPNNYMGTVDLIIDYTSTLVKSSLEEV
jgi:hypothetical protein